MNQREQVIEVLENNGGFATLGYLYLKVNTEDWKTKTPFATIRRIVQDKKFFYKIKPGLWALKNFEKKVNELLNLNKSDKEIFNHTYVQGLLVELGNIKGFQTFVPAQDSNKIFLNKKLNELASLTQIHPFTYSNIVNRAKTVDVTWFNSRKYPAYFFEVEHSTNFQNSILKYFDLQDFNSLFYIVSPKQRLREYNHKINLNAFKEIKSRIKFVDYEFISKLHSKSFELQKLGNL